MSLLSSSSPYEQALTELQFRIEAGCPEINMKVYNTRKLLGVESYTQCGISTSKDYRKAKVIYTCLNADVPAINNFIQTCLEKANAQINDPNHHVSYVIQHYPDIASAILSGAPAHSVKTWNGADLYERLLFILSKLEEFLATGYDDSIARDIHKLKIIIPTIIASATYIARYDSGVTYRVSMYDYIAGRHFQVNVGNILILSGERALPQLSLAPPRKKRASKYDEIEPTFTYGKTRYYVDDQTT